MDNRLLRKLKGCLDKAERHLLVGVDAGDEAVLDGLASETTVPKLISALKDARAQTDRAHELCMKLLSTDGDELSFTPTRRKANLDALDRAPVGRSSAPRIVPIPSRPRELGGAHLAEQVRDDEARRLRAYWGM